MPRAVRLFELCTRFKPVYWFSVEVYIMFWFVNLQIRKLTAKIEEKYNLVGKLQEKIKDSMARYLHSIKEDKYYNFLKRICKKKYKPPKPDDGKSFFNPLGSFEKMHDFFYRLCIRGLIEILEAMTYCNSTVCMRIVMNICMMLIPVIIVIWDLVRDLVKNSRCPQCVMSLARCRIPNIVS